MGLQLNGRCILLVLAVQLAYLVQAVRDAGNCDKVFEGLSNCMMDMGKKIGPFSQSLEEQKNADTICEYWNDFHSCAVAVLVDCHVGAAEIWDKLKRDSKKLDIQGSLFQMCSSSGSVSPRPVLPAFLPLLMVSLSALLIWIF
ncbi:neuritin [Spea bombifrons]|uniref:neuritin n=1 Tax=Spea bombifrons TaxID=233779 RepID=UPI00234B1D67|nr:neuritin [Spea bombifrons]